MTRTNGALNRRDVMKISIGGAAALWLGLPNAAFAQQTQIKAAWYGGQDTHDRMQQAIKLFTQKNPDIAVNVEFAPFAEFYNRLPVQYSGGGAPDMHRHSMTYLFDYTKRGLLADLSPFVGQTIDISALYPGVVEIGKDGDATHAIGNNQISVALFYNKAKLDAAGAGALDNLTWDSFRDLAIKLGKAGGANHYGVSDNGGFLGLFEVYLFQRGKSLYKGDNAVGFEKADLVDWLAYWESLRAEQGAPPPSVTAESAGFQNATIVKNRSAMQIGWSQQLVFYQALMQDELDIHACPVVAGAPDNGHLIRALDFWVIPESSQNKEAAAKLINFLLNDEEALGVLGLTLGGPASDRATAVLAKTADAPSTKVLNYLTELRKTAPSATPRWISGHGELEALMGRLNASIGFAQTTPDAAADNFLTEASRILG
ncbi:Predicted rhamnose oligosaccharide ABC transport s ystem, substrate-binding component [Devosia sp. DBB001]|nr:Predicted rhamnose oligosaccharide ABC transport s ystem, substrate-binding component [Devosia sp. DBB001]